MIVYQNGAHTPEYIEMKARMDALYEQRGETKPFVVGQSYQTNEGKTVVCVELGGFKGYETARFDDGEPYEHRLEPTRRHPEGQLVTGMTGWRYNRDHDRGRCTGTAFDHSDPRCVIPESAA